MHMSFFKSFEQQHPAEQLAQAATPAERCFEARLIVLICFPFIKKCIWRRRWIFRVFGQKASRVGVGFFDVICFCCIFVLHALLFFVESFRVLIHS